MEEIETPVLIVGGGSSGSALGIELGHRGASCLVVEQGTGEIKTPKTGHISARTMEHCRRWGIAEDVRDAGFPRDFPLDTALCTSLNGYEIARKPTPSINNKKPLPTSPENRLRCPQMYFDPLLARVAQGYPGVRFRYLWEFVEIEENGPDGCVSIIKDGETGDTVRIKSRYLIGADGANSRVRSCLDLGMEGKPFLNYSLIVFFNCPNFFSYHDKAPGERYSFVNEQGWQGNFTAINGDNLWRLAVKGQEHHYELGDFDARAAVNACLGGTDVPFEILLVQPWKRTELAANQFISGSTALIGDAAHTMSPTGGFGMNTAVDDAVNIGWKLWALQEGWGGPGLFGSYQPERKPVAQRNAKMASDNFDLWVEFTEFPGILDDSPRGESVRAKAAAAFNDVTRRVQESDGVILGYRYDDSPVCIPDGTPAPPDSYGTYVQSCRPGGRAPHVWIGPGKSTLDLFGKSFVCFYAGERQESAELLESAARDRGVPFDKVQIDSPELEAAYDRGLVLVRPDGHVCFAGESAVHSGAEASHVLNVVTGVQE